MLWASLLTTGLVQSAGVAAPASPPAQDLARHFGFGALQMYKIEQGISLLRLADLNHDSRVDAVLWNGQKSRLEFFYQPAPDAPATPLQPANEPNQIANVGPLRNETLSVPYRVASIEVGDVNGDGRRDLVLFGEPKDVVVLPGLKDGGFGPLEPMRAPEGNPRPGCLAVADFDGDKRTDVALLGEEQLLVFAQNDDGRLGKPTRIGHAIKQTLAIMTGDLNRDGCADLIIGADSDEYGFHVLLGAPGRGLGAIRPIRAPKSRSMTMRPGASGDHLLAIEAATGRLVEYSWRTAGESAARWPMTLHSYPTASRGRQRPVAIGDLNGDGMSDVVAVDADGAQLMMFLAGADGLEPGVAFPGLVKTLDVVIGDVDGDQRDEVVSVSREERMIGVSRYKDGRLSFPEAYPSDGVPLVVGMGHRSTDGRGHALAYVSTDTQVPGSDERTTAITVVDAETRSVASRFAIESLPDDPSGLRWADANQDGRNDLLLFVRFAPLRVYLQGDDGAFAAFDGPATRSGLTKEAALEDYALADVTGDGKPEVLLAQKTLGRALAIREGQWTVVEQFNAESSDAQLKGLAALPGAKAGSPMVATYDRKTGDLLVFERRADGAYAVARDWAIGAFDPTAFGDLPRGAGAADLLIADAQKLARLSPAAAMPSLVEVHAYETKMKDAWLTDAVSGDVNRDGVADVVLVDSRKANLEVLTTPPSGGFARVLSFQVFQGKRFSTEQDYGTDPREVLVGDLSGDGVDDVALLAHDRLIVYPGQ